MKYNFDEIVERKNTKSIKYDNSQFEVSEEALPLWVADMDFRTPVEVREALKELSEHAIFGYSYPDETYLNAVINWMRERFGYTPKREEIVPTPGVVFALAQCVKAFTEPEDAVLIQEPVYHPFRGVIESNGRKVVNNLLVRDDSGYKIDFEDFERQIKENDVKLFILCNPHNPVGRVFTKEELERMAEICLENDVIIVSDEIHADFVYEPHEHVMLPTLGEKIRENTVLCTAPSKTFNLAGLQCSNIIIPDEKKREAFKSELQKNGYGSLSVPAYTACQAAYTYGADWVDNLKTYLKDNMEYVKTYLDQHVPQIKTEIPEGTYLMWLDCRELGLGDKDLNQFFIDKAKMWLDPGTLFGEGGSGYMRLNVALPRERLREALENLREACNGEN